MIFVFNLCERYYHQFRDSYLKPFNVGIIFFNVLLEWTYIVLRLFGVPRYYTNIEILYKYRDIIQISRLNITFIGEIYKNDKSLLDFKLLWYHECHYWNEASSVSLSQFSGCFQNNMYTINLTEQSTLFILIINTYLWQVLIATFALVICPATSSIALVSTSTRPY